MQIVSSCYFSSSQMNLSCHRQLIPLPQSFCTFAIVTEKLYRQKPVSKPLFPYISHLNTGKPALNSLVTYPTNIERQSPPTMQHILYCPALKGHHLGRELRYTDLLDEIKLGTSGGSELSLKSIAYYREWEENY